MPADQFERLSDGDHIVHARRHLQRLDLVAASAAHGGDDSALGAAGDVRLISGFADSLDDVVDLLLGGLLRHIDDHGLILLGIFGP